MFIAIGHFRRLSEVLRALSSGIFGVFTPDFAILGHL